MCNTQWEDYPTQKGYNRYDIGYEFICEHPERRIKFYESHNYDKFINVAENYVWPFFYRNKTIILVGYLLHNIIGLISEGHHKIIGTKRGRALK